MTQFVPLVPQQLRYFAHELTLKRAADDSQKLTTALMDAQVDLNPHQVDAALFAFKSPLSRGAILADEVGLGKTIEAGLVMTQKWAEGKRRILVICPASLRGQWRDELADKFFLPGAVVDSKTFKAASKQGVANPLDRSGDDSTIQICSFHFAAGKELELIEVPWDLVVIDEAHRLRNVYKPENKIGRRIRGALVNVPKILLTATPLQNSLMELYGLVSFIDEHAFGDVKTFRARYSRTTGGDAYADLKARLAPLCHRTLRRQVTEYVKYTTRIPLTQEFTPSEDEQVLYELVSDYLQRPELFALPSSQRALITLVLRKLLASSTFAIAGGLDTMTRRLEAALRAEERLAADLTDAVEQDLGEDFEQLDDLTDEWPDEGQERPPSEPLSADQLESLRGEVIELGALRDQAVAIDENAKGDALVSALAVAFEKARSLGAAEKAVIFTESRRTQNYLLRLLSQYGYGDDLVLFNGTNNDDRAKETYRSWMTEHAGSDRVTGTRAADIRSAIVDEFRGGAKVMIATEAAAEGVNLQFCSIVVNYDLPWNPQRIEQRIGRCHRYGQQHDVVVVNFLNRENAADQRVFELLDQKFKLFSGVFGASDEVLGSIESGVDIERRIADIYQRCRQPEDIDAEFVQLQFDLDEQISEVMADTRQKLLENFDVEVHDRLRVSLAASRDSLSRAEDLLWKLARSVLATYAEFDDANGTFDLRKSPPGYGGAVGEMFHLGSAQDGGHRLRFSHPLAQFVLEQAKLTEIKSHCVVLDYSSWAKQSIALEPFVGTSGWLAVEKLSIEGEQTEEHLLIVAATDAGDAMGEDAARRLLEVPGNLQALDAVAASTYKDALTTQRSVVLSELAARQANWFDQEIDKFDRWAEDQRHALRTELKDLDMEIKDLKKQARTAGALPEKLKMQRKIRDLESRRDLAWRSYDDSARDVEVKKDEMLDRVEQRLSTKAVSNELFAIRWEMV